MPDPALVIDANIAIEWVAPEPETPVGQAALPFYEQSGGQAPGLFWAETHNVLLKLLRTKKIASDSYAAAKDSLSDLGVALDDTPDRLRVIDLAERHALSVYDALYLEVTLRKASSLATNDQALRRAAAAEGVALV